MGYGVPASIGAQFAFPDKTVINIDGDGSFTMTMVEVITAVQYGLKTKFVVLDNEFLGMVRQWQQLFFNKRYSAVNHPCPDFAMIARGYGADAITVKTREELPAAIDKMLATDKPFVLHVHVAKEENVYPMVASGKALDDMIHSEELI